MCLLFVLKIGPCQAKADLLSQEGKGKQNTACRASCPFPVPQPLTEPVPNRLCHLLTPASQQPGKRLIRHTRHTSIASAVKMHVYQVCLTSLTRVRAPRITSLPSLAVPADCVWEGLNPFSLFPLPSHSLTHGLIPEVGTLHPLGFSSRLSQLHTPFMNSHRDRATKCIEDPPKGIISFHL